MCASDSCFSSTSCMICSFLFCFESNILLAASFYCKPFSGYFSESLCSHCSRIFGHMIVSKIWAAAVLASLLFCPKPFDTTSPFMSILVKNLNLGFDWCSCTLNQIFIETLNLLTRPHRLEYTEKTVQRFATIGSICQAGVQPRYRTLWHLLGQIALAHLASNSSQLSSENGGLAAPVASLSSCCCNLCQWAGSRWSPN